MEISNADRQENIRLLKQELAPIDQELAALGLPAVATLRDSNETYKAGIPILPKWLFEVHRYDTKSVLISALTVRWARPLAAKPLVEAFHQTDSDQCFQGLKWEIANALYSVADDSIADDLIAIAQDKRQGRDREMVVGGLGRLKDPRVVGILIDLLSDPDVEKRTIEGLAKIAPAQARPFLEPFTRHKQPWVRKQAQKAIANIDKKNPLDDREVTATAPVFYAVSPHEPIPVGYMEASVRCDYEHTAAILKPLAEIVDAGFGNDQIQQIMSGINDTGTISWNYPIQWNNQQSSLRILLELSRGSRVSVSICRPPGLYAVA